VLVFSFHVKIQKYLRVSQALSSGSLNQWLTGIEYELPAPTDPGRYTLRLAYIPVFPEG
jgi:hypothetical protein